jgi:hypothetical protein
MISTVILFRETLFVGLRDITAQSAKRGRLWHSWLRHCGVRLPIVPLEFFIDITLPAAVRPWGRLSLQ